MTLYFLRHGQTLANLNGNFAGQKDNSPLTDLGIQQAKDAAKAWKQQNIQLDKIVSSPLIRARKTAEIFAEGIGYV
ncbi:MAG: phosphoglycerate mutase family protein [bacterium]